MQANALHGSSLVLGAGKQRASCARNEGVTRVLGQRRQRQSGEEGEERGVGMRMRWVTGVGALPGRRRPRRKPVSGRLGCCRPAGWLLAPGGAISCSLGGSKNAQVVVCCAHQQAAGIGAKPKRVHALQSSGGGRGGRGEVRGRHGRTCCRELSWWEVAGQWALDRQAPVPVSAVSALVPAPVPAAGPAAGPPPPPAEAAAVPAAIQKAVHAAVQAAVHTFLGTSANSLTTAQSCFTP